MLPPSKTLARLALAVGFMQVGFAAPIVIGVLLNAVWPRAARQGPYWPIWIGVALQTVGIVLSLSAPSACQGRRPLLAALTLHALGLAAMPGYLLAVLLAPEWFLGAPEPDPHKATQEVFDVLINVLIAATAGILLHLMAQVPFLVYLRRLLTCLGTPAAEVGRTGFERLWLATSALGILAVALAVAGKNSTSVFTAGLILGGVVLLGELVAAFIYIPRLESGRQALEKLRIQASRSSDNPPAPPAS